MDLGALFAINATETVGGKFLGGVAGVLGEQLTRRAIDHIFGPANSAPLFNIVVPMAPQQQETNTETANE